MNRPEAIVMFERCYLGALAVGAINSALHWNAYGRIPQVQQANALIGAWYLPAITMVGLLIPLLLWYFVARRGSVVAKWIVVVFAGLGVLGILFSLTLGRFVSPLAAILGIVALVLNVIAASTLFRPDAKAWLGEAAAEPIA